MKCLETQVSQGISTLLSPPPLSFLIFSATLAFACCLTEEPELSPAVAPGLFVAASDSRHFLHLCEQVYRFNPIKIGAHETSMFHGINERVAVGTQARLVLFIRQLVLQADRRC